MTTHPLLSAQRISKSFGGSRALADVDFDLHAGEMVALVGANGAGKSTLVKILCGAHQPDSGELRIAGSPHVLHDVRAAQALGIAVAHQHTTVLPALSGAENILLGREPRRFGLIDRRLELAEAKALADRFGVAIDLTRPCSELGLGDRKILDILKALSTAPRILILDEPTATLNLTESRLLFSFLRELKSQGLGILFISHHMNEVFANCDRVAVLKDGHKVHDGRTGELDATEVVRLMVGRTATRDERPARVVREEIAVSLRDLKLGRLTVRQMEVRRGEIVGIAGVLGAGQTDLLERLAGIPSPAVGKIALNGRTRLPRSVREAVSSGIFLIADDRLKNAVLPGLSIEENLSSATLQQNSRLGFIDRRRSVKQTRDMVQALEIKCASPDQNITELSGGNQQKVMFARWLARIAFESPDRPLLFLLDNPTEGVDVGAKAEIHNLIFDFVEKGHAVIIASSDFDELIQLSDKVYCVSNGLIDKYIDRENLSEEKLLLEVN